MKTIRTWLKRAAMLSVTVAFAAAGLGANAATSLTLNDGDTLTGVYEDYEITIAAGATVTFNGATITHTSGNAPAVNCLGDATIILAPGSVNAVTNTVGGYSCVRPAENATLTIRGSGTLTAAGGYNAAAIGSGSGQNGTCGSIVIKGGTIEAFGGTTGAGIGSGNSGTCGSIVIEGGTVTAQGGDWSAGIGSAYNGTCGDITISGGTVTAEVDRSTSDNMTCTAAIGAGCRGTCGNILISGGTVVADAHSGYSRDDACAIGATYTNGKCGDITLTTGITSLTATKGATAQQHIGQGDGSATVGRIYGMLRFDKEYSNDGNTVTLTPKASFESYTVTWKNDDGTTADTTSVEYGLLPSHAGLTKAGDGYLEYLFAGWTPEFAEVESNVAYTAVFIAVPAVRSTGGDAEWFVDADEGALRSGVIGDNQNTWLRTSLPRPCVFSFKWKTSSETGCDNLHFTVNGAYVLDTEGRQVATISGVGNDWTTVSVVISNSLDVLEWKYGKDGSAVSGQDCGWVKDFEMATFDGEIRSLSVVPNYDGLATVTAYAAKDVVMDVFPPLARHGYALLGYFTAAEGGELVEPPYALSADTTLYAHWAKTTDFDTSDPTAEWTIEDDGITWRTGAIDHSTNTWATYTVKRPCTVTYKWKTSTEANNDPLVFYVDDVEQSRISGESADWVDVSLSFEDSKNHVLKWVYSKDWSDTGRYDCGWIRDFVVTPYDSWAVTRDLNYEGATELETRYVKKGSQLDVSEFPPLDEPREGYSCSWAMAPWSGDALSAPVDISADTTLYAHWIKQHGFDEIDTTCQTPWTWIDDGSIRTGKIGDSGETWVTISVTGPCDVSFKWMTSSESGWDKLHFYVDDSHKIEISGVTPEWESYTASVGSGDHVLKWTYTKDGGGAFGEDCGWVKDIVITAPESAPYTVTWKNADGTTLETDADLEAGAVPVYNSALPTLAATAQYTYEFAGWEPEFELVSSNTTNTAKYTATLRSYDVTWQDEDCTPLGATNIFYGATPTYSGATPVKPATPKFTYTFAGWDPEVAAVTGEATYTAKYDVTINEYTITWKNDDGTVIDSADVAYDETPSHAAPTKASTAQYDYEFAGWSPAVASVTGEATYTATFTPILRSYTITWLNEDGTALDTSTVEYGATPSHAAPTKASTAQYDYTFAGWGNVVAVSGEATYQATFTPVLRSYTVSWVVEGETVASGAVEYGTTPAYGGATPTKAETAEYTYTFAGWDKAVVAVTGAATYTATFNATKRSYMVSWVVEGASVASGTVEYGTTPTYGGETPTKESTAEYSYAFTGWSPAVSAVTGAATYTATFEATRRSYTVSWVVEGATVASGSVEYGQTPAYTGDTPTKAETAEYSYEFAGWSPAVSAVTGEATYTAQFNSTKRSYMVSWVVEGETVASGAVEYGQTPTYDGDTPTKESTAEYSYTFTGWNPTVVAVAGDATYTAQFSQTKRSYMVSWVVEGVTVASGSVEYGQTPTYDGETPTKAADAQYTYEFAGWTPAVAAVTGDATYTAQFNATPKDIPVENVLFSEDFDTASLAPGLTMTVVGSFKSYPGIKAGLGTDDSGAFSFGRSTCGSSAFDNYMTTLTLDFGKETYVTRIEFDEMERYGDWGSQGRILVDGTVVDGLTFTKPGSAGYGNSRVADSEFRHKTLTLERSLTTIALQVHDITTESEEFIDNLRVYGYGDGTVTVTWRNEDGTILEADKNVALGTMPTYDGATPTKAATAQYSYTFADWTPAPTAVVSNTTYTAVFTPVTRSYTVTWVVEGETVASGAVEYGTTPFYDGETPTKAETAEYTYTFSGWSPTVSTVTGEATYTAQFSQTKRSYTVSWVVEGATVASGAVEYGQMPTYGGETPTKESTAEYSYTFSGWSPAVAVVTGEATYTAQFNSTKRSYTVSWVVEGATVASGTVEYGQTPSYGGDTPTKAETAEYSYEFTGWTPVVAAVTGDATYTAQFNSTKRSYTVSWVVEGATVASGTVEYGQTPSYGGETPTKESTAQYDYEFTGWGDVVAVTGDATYMAVFTPVTRSYNVTWVVDGMTVASGTVEYGATPVYGGDTPTKAETAEYSYAFTGWTPVVAAVTGDATYTAQFSQTKRSYTVAWVVEGVTVASGAVEYGQTPEFVGETPTKTEDENYTYAFSGWTPAVVAVTGDATYTATFTATPKETEEPEEPYEGTETIDGIAWSYTVANDEATLTGAQFAEGAIAIPETVHDGVPVMAIEEGVFADNQDITEVTISRYVRRIGADVGVKSADWAQNLEEAGFDGSYPAFGNCESLMDYRVDADNEVFEEIGGALYYRNTPTNAKELALYPSGRSTLYFADGLTVTKIGDGACAWCHKFTELTIPASVREIGVRSFDFCREIVTLTIPATVTDIGWGAFLMNIALVNADINGTDLAIGDYAFYHSFMADNAGNLVIRGGVKDVGFNAFCHSMHLGAVVMEDGVTNIAMNAFSQCDYLSTVTLPDTLTAIGAGAFCGCSELREIIVPLSVDEIGLSQQDDGSDGGAFAGCYALARIYLPLSLKPATAEETNDYLANVFNGLGLENMSAAEIAEILTWYSDPSEIGGGDEPGEPYDGTETIDGIEWSYTVANGEATITGVSALSGDVVIPATVAGGVPVTAIADYMDYRLRYNEDITSVTIPASVTNIGEGNLQSCTALETITVAGGNATYASDDGILYDVDKTVLLVSPGGKTVVTNMPESVVEIASGAFEGSRVQFCMMAQYATNIAERAFSGCSYLSTATIGKHIRNIGAYAFENCGNIRVVNFASDSECEVIGVGAFSGCEKLQKVTIPDSVIVIRGGAFSGCSELFDVTIGSGVVVIGDATVPHYIDEWGDDATMDFDPAFGNCANLRDFKVSKDNAIYEAIDGCIYYRVTPNTAKTLAVYPSGRGDLHFYGGVTVTAIGEGACSYCNKLKKLTIPQSVKDIGIEAFAHCEGVTNVYIQANSVTNISFGAFAWNMNTMDVEVAGSVRTVGEWAFMHNFGPYNLNDDFTTGQLVLHEGIREIGRGAFERCFRIGEIEIPRSVQRMGESAFADTRLARRIVIGNGLRVIPESAFECSWGSKLSELIIGNNVVGIGACAFSGCEKLRNLNIPSAVWDIGDNAFSGCTSLCALNLPSNLKSIGAGAFGGSSYGMMMSSARSLLGIGAQTFDGCTDLRRVLVPNSVTNIGVGAFGAVTSENLDRIYLPSSLKSADDSDTLAFLADQFPGLNLGIGDVTWYDDESELNYVTVTFDPNNGGETWSEQVLDYLDALPVPVTNGYAFAGWWTTSDDSGEKITISRHFSVDTTLYAHWIETSVTFGEDAPWTAVYDDYYGEWVLQSGDVAFGHTSSASMTVTGPCIVEFNFMNYMDEWGTSNDIELLVDGEMVEYYGIFNWKSATYEIPDAGEHTVTWRYVNLNGSFNDYARLRNFSATPAVAHTVTFNLEGGTMAEATSRQVLRSLGALPIPVKAGYIFNGWWWTDGDGFAERVSADFAVEDDVELVARWEKSPFSAVGGDASWFLDENGDYRTEAIGKDATVWTELRFKGPANISFSYKTSMSWMSDDHFEFVVDGERAVYQGGSSSWRSYSAAFSNDAEHVVRWVVRRNDYGDDDYEAENCVWLTYLNLPEAIIAVETPDQPPVVVDDTKMEEPVENGDGTRTIAAKEGETLTQSDVASVTVASPVDPAIDITAAYTKTLVDNTIVLQLAVPALEDVPEVEDDDEDPSGMLDDVDDIDDGKIAAMPEPDVSDPDPEKREEVGALPIKMYPGLYYQASWGDDLNNLTPGAKFRADGSQTHIGVIKQNGSRGFYKISVSER